MGLGLANPNPNPNQARRHRLLPARHELLAGGAGWECSQSHAAWTVLLPVRDRLVAAADLRVAVRSDAFNIHLAGQEDTPLLAGELFGRLLPHKCSWRLNPPRDGDAGEQAEVAVTLFKAEPATWPDLIKTWYT